MNGPGPALQLDHAATVYSTDYLPVLAGSGTFVMVAVRNPLLADPHSGRGAAIPGTDPI